MKYTIQQGEKSNKYITVSLSLEQKTKLHQKVLRGFQQEVTKPGFRKGHVPLEMVAEMVNPLYLMMGIYEEVIHKSMQLILDENKDIRFIGQPYDLQTEAFEKEDKDGNVSLEFKLDTYPEAEVKNKKREKKKLTALDVSLTDQEIEDVMNNMKRQYAEYEDQEVVSEETISKIKLSYQDKDGNETETGSVFAGPEDYAEYDSFKTYFAGKNIQETVSIPYSEDLPKVLQAKNPEGVATISATIIDNKKQVLPEFDDAMIAKLFPDQDEIKTKDDLIAKINVTLLEQKAEKALLEQIDNLLKDMEESIEVAIPQALIEEEMKSRKEQIAQQYGGVEAFDKVMEKQSEAEQKAFETDLRKASEQALQKYLRLQKLVELNELDVNRDTRLDVEKKLYHAHTGKTFEESYEADASTTKKPATKKKAPAKKATTKKTTKKGDDADTTKTTKKAATKKAPAKKTTTKKEEK